MFCYSFTPPGRNCITIYSHAATKEAAAADINAELATRPQMHGDSGKRMVTAAHIQTPEQHMELMMRGVFGSAA